MNKNCLWILLIFLLMKHMALGQDSLENVLRSKLTEAKTAEEKVHALLDLHDFSEIKRDRDAQQSYLNSALQIAKEQDYTKGYAVSLNRLIKYHVQNGNQDQARAFFTQLMALCNEGNGLTNICIAGRLSIIPMLRRQGKYNEASVYAFEALNKAEELKDTTYLSAAHNHIGLLQYLTGDTVKAIRHLEQSLDYANATGNDRKAAQLMVNLAVVYKNYKKFEEAKALFESALLFMKKTKNSKGLAMIYTNLANLYSFEQDYEKAGKVYKKAFKLLEEVKAIPQLCEAYMAYSQALEREGSCTEAITYAEKALEIAEDIGYTKIEVAAHFNIAKCASKLGDYKTAFTSIARHHAVADSLRVAAHEKTLNELELEHQNKQQKSQLEVLNRERELQQMRIKKQNNLLWASAIAGIAVIAVLVLVVTGYRNKRKANALLASKNQEVQSKNKEITDSIHYAKNIQDAFLPHEDLKAYMGREVALCYLPRDIVSGDFYWAYRTSGLLMWAVVDCTGHGVPGALMSILGNTGLDAAVKQEGLKEPSEIMEFLSTYVEESLSRQKDIAYSKDGMDMSLCVLEEDTLKLKFSAANNAGVVCRGAEQIKLEATKRPVGYYVEDIRFSQLEIQLQKEDIVYLYSDGYPDQFGGQKGKKLKARKFLDLLSEVHQIPTEKQQERLISYFNFWKGEHEQLDDVCVMGVKA